MLPPPQDPFSAPLSMAWISSLQEMIGRDGGHYVLWNYDGVGRAVRDFFPV